MKKTITRWMVATAALAVMVGSAAAQSYKAEIPLSFRVGDKVMTPGTYQFQAGGLTGNMMLSVYNVDTKQSALLMAGANGSVSKEWKKINKPVLAFECAENICALRHMWTGDDRFAYTFPGPRVRSDELRTAVVALTPLKAD